MRLPILLLLMAGSGCAALIYEIVWFQLLQLVIGSSAVSLGLLLAAYMGGLCVGSAALPRLVSRMRNPLHLYAYLESGIGALGIAILFGLPLVGRLYLAGPMSGMAALIARGVVSAVCLIPPTLLMGASFPAIARWVEGTSKAVPMMGALYSANIAGGVAGCLVAGFYLLRLYDMAVATYVAVGINAVVALSALAFGKSGDRHRILVLQNSVSVPRFPRFWPNRPLVYLAIALSGAAALGAEVVWTRLLSLLLGATVYTFSIILAVFLIGLWAGSAASSVLLRRIDQPVLALAGCQILLAVAIAGTAYVVTHVLPFWPVDPWLSLDPWFTFDLDLFRVIRTIFVPTLLWGASLPLAMAAVAREGEDPARPAGAIYAANTAGSVIGALAYSLIFIPGIGTRASEQVLIGLAGAAAIVTTASHVRDQARLRAAAAWMVAGVAGARSTSPLW